jgi:FkbM family methyltransferase
MPDICVVRDGVIFIAQPAVPLGWHVAFFGTYEPELREILRTVLSAGAVAVDVGANVGWHTGLMARLVGEEGHVFAAEANPSVRKRLEDNLNINRFVHAEVIPFALAQAAGVVDFFGPPADDAGSGDGHVVPVSRPAQSGMFRVETRSLDDILSAAHVTRLDLIKIDVEGFEWPVLQGAEQSVMKFRPHIIFEYNADYVSRGGGAPELVAEYFTRHRYRLYAIGRNWAEAVELCTWPQCADIWAIPDTDRRQKSAP